MAATTAKKSTTAAKKAEAANTSTSFDFEGATFTVPSAKKLPFAVLEAIEEDRSEVAIIRAIVGPEQWVTFRNLATDIEGFEVFAEQVAAAAGFGDSGN
ncbi:hypothetical protein EES41_23265 [Streptomyces sp. ADI95-16]|uniref:hypothetical protein n=1 Tax=Streptomyces sp. ADI95-16 TaxID=1522758 RepID=UPI000F434CA4|nr:hypothetical protein [Streptomyces sp. ADI95-16]AYV29639.1 hypothetical protein EES41_23265 [Streptomyces sp. ADI95-16]